MRRFKWKGVVLGMAALLLRILAAQFPQQTEIVYSRTIFPVIRRIFDSSLSKLPFPSFYLFAGAIAGVILFIFISTKKKRGMKAKAGYILRFSLNVSGILVFLFLVLWGYNYQRIPVYQQLSLDPVPLNEKELLEEIKLTHSELVLLRALLTSDTLPIEKTIPYSVLEKKVREVLKEDLALLGFDSKGHPRTKEFVPAGFLQRLGILGIYFPFTGESYIDPTLHPLEKPFTVAHEMAHSFGINNEGEANFISWAIGARSGDPLLQYSAQLQLFRYQLNDLYRYDKAAYQQVLELVEQGIKNDIASILLKSSEIKPLFRELSRKSNDLFLKTQGVKAGVASYAQLPMLAHTWRNQPNSMILP